MCEHLRTYVNFCCLSHGFGKLFCSSADLVDAIEKSYASHVVSFVFSCMCFCFCLYTLDFAFFRFLTALHHFNVAAIPAQLFAFPELIPLAPFFVV